MDAMGEAAERVIMGPERRSHIISDAEKRLTAYHETGHALIGLLEDTMSSVHKVTIIPRGRAGGYTLSIPKEDRDYSTKSEMIADLKMFLGGRVAEALVLKDISSGASSDLERATHLARRMVCEYGMSDRLGSMTFGHPDGQVFLGRDITRERNYSDDVAAVIDEEVHKLMDEAYKGAEKMLTEHMDKLHLIANTLLEKETLEATDLRMLMTEGHLPESSLKRKLIL
jgi:cell division protease FtsH